jgi:hypothetical protein
VVTDTDGEDVKASAAAQPAGMLAVLLAAAYVILA